MNNLLIKPLLDTKHLTCAYEEGYTYEGGVTLDEIIFADITDFVRDKVARSTSGTGFVLIKNPGKDSALFIQEARQHVEPDIIDRVREYAQPCDWTSFFQPYQALPVRSGELVLGKWQSVLMMAMDGNKKFNQSFSIPVEFVPGTLQTLAIDTGKCGKPVHERNKSDYVRRGSERIFDITDMLARNARVMDDTLSGDASVYAGTGNTTCVLYYDVKGEGVESLVKRLDAFAPQELSVDYRHNNMEMRHNVPLDERQNGRAHVLCGTLLQSSITFPSSGPIGRVYLVEMDGPRRNRLLHIGVAENVKYKTLRNFLVE